MTSLHVRVQQTLEPQDRVLPLLKGVTLLMGVVFALTLAPKPAGSCGSLLVAKGLGFMVYGLGSLLITPRVAVALPESSLPTALTLCMQVVSCKHTHMRAKLCAFAQFWLCHIPRLCLPRNFYLLPYSVDRG